MIVAANKKHLSGKRLEAYQSFKAMAEAGKKFSPNQMNYIEGLYEKCMEGAGFGACDLKHDFGRRRN
jgi:hypothetical protein